MPEQEFTKNQYKYILLVLLLVVGFIIFKQFQPYLSGILGALTLYVLLRGQMKYFTEKKKWKKGLASSFIVLETLLLFLIPLTAIALIAVDTISGVHIDPDAIKNALIGFVNGVEQRYHVQIFTPENLSFIPKLGTNVIQALAANSYSLIINVFVILFVLYFMLYSYDDFEIAIKEMLPFSQDNKKAFILETKSIIQANAIGIPLLAIVQGLFAYIGYVIIGVPSPLLYAVLTAFATVIPLVGTGIVYVPLAISFFIQHNIGGGVALLLYGMIIIGSVDNVVRFLLQKRLADTHPLITIFGVIIGIPMFGFWGVIFGPLILSLFVLFINMYRHDYIPGSVAQPHVSGKTKVQDFKEIKNIKFPSLRKAPRKKRRKMD